jgi:UDP-glucose 4-epimerase
MQKGLPITIYGDGTQTRDFVYVKDVAITLTKALVYPLTSGIGLTCNIGTGQSISLLQLVNILKDCYPDWKSEIKFAPSRLGDIQHSQADITNATSLLGFTPHWSVESGMRLFVESLLSA